MSIREYRESDAEAVFAIYRELIALVPHEIPVDFSQFREQLTRPFAREAKDVLDPQAERAFVAESGGTIEAFGCGSASVREGRHIKAGVGMIRFILARPHAQQPCRELIRALDAEILPAAPQNMYAWPYWFGPAFFGMGCGFMPSAWPWIGHWLSEEGYRSSTRIPGEWRLIKSMAEPPAPARLPEGVRVERYRSEDLCDFPEHCEWSFRLMCGGENLGFSENIASGGIVHGSGMTIVHTTELRIAEAARGKGLGRALQRHVLAQAYAAGCRTASLTTALDNFRAQALYRSEGYLPVDVVYGFEKEK